MDIFYSVKYALTKGIVEVHGEEKYRDDRVYLSVKNECGAFEVLLESEYAKTRGEAVSKALKKRDKRILSLRKQILKLERTLF